MSIVENLQKILSSRYGKDVRQAIHDAIEDCYEDGKAGATDLIARQRIDALESSALTRKIVSSLPTSNISITTVYMILADEQTEHNIYNEYMYINNAWEQIGSSAVDLSDYYTKEEVDTSINAINDSLGNVESLATTAKTVVPAINELKDKYSVSDLTSFSNATKRIGVHLYDVVSSNISGMPSNYESFGKLIMLVHAPTDNWRDTYIYITPTTGIYVKRGVDSVWKLINYDASIGVIS